MYDELWIGVLRMQVVIPGARSRKDRRQVVQSLRDRLVNNFGVSCAELDDGGSWARATLGIVVCSNDKGHTAEILDAVERFARKTPDASIGACSKDTFPYETDTDTLTF